MSTQDLPYQLLAKYKGRKIGVLLRNGECYEGRLSGIGASGHHRFEDILLRDVKQGSDWVLIRGNNILAFYPLPNNL